MQFEHKGLLSDEMLERFRERAPGYDEENRFFFEDFEELKAANYLLMNVPEELGGPSRPTVLGIFRISGATIR